MESWGPELQVLTRTGIAALLGALIGLERELKGRPAGLRTHLMIAAASALFIPLGTGMVDAFQVREGATLLRADPIRVIEATITGVSFVGAGTILLREGEGRIEGLTTAASILFTAAVGMAVGLERYVIATGAALGVIAVLWGIGFVEYKLVERGAYLHDPHHHPPEE